MIIFLSDGEANITDEIMRDLCRRSNALGYGLPWSMLFSFKLTHI